jgi:small subunit ribosomal protein S8
MKDNISDMLTRIRNGQKSKLYEINLYCPTPLICLKILNVLYKEGYIRGLKKSYLNKKLFIKVLLKYDIQGNSVIKKIERISTPGRRIYTSTKSL